MTNEEEEILKKSSVEFVVFGLSPLMALKLLELLMPIGRARWPGDDDPLAYQCVKGVCAELMFNLKKDQAIADLLVKRYPGVFPDSSNPSEAG